MPRIFNLDTVGTVAKISSWVRMCVDNSVSFQREANRCSSKKMRGEKKTKPLTFPLHELPSEEGKPPGRSLQKDSFTTERGTEEVQRCPVAEIAPVMDWLFPCCVFSRFWILYERFLCFLQVSSCLDLPTPLLPQLFIYFWMNTFMWDYGAVSHQYCHSN